MNAHLTDEQMLELLAAESATNEHVLECAACEAELSGLRASLSNFRDATTGLAAATPLQRPVAASAAHWSLRPAMWTASLATVAVLMAVSAATFHPLRHPVAPKPTPAVAVPADASEVSDEALLDGIQRDLSTSIPPSLEPLAVPAATGEISTQN